MCRSACSGSIATSWRSRARMIDVLFYANLIQVTLRAGPFPNVRRATSLLLGTVAQESHFTYTEQLGGGPALGLCQCEGATEASVWQDYLAYQPALADWFLTRCGRDGPNASALQYDMVYGILLMRTIYYWRDEALLPVADDIAAQAALWKRVYNTPAGAGTPEDYMESYARLVAPYYPT